jgi:hypothetical protein
MKNDLTTGAWQHDIGCPISIVLFSTSDVVSGIGPARHLASLVVLARMALFGGSLIGPSPMCAFLGHRLSRLGGSCSLGLVGPGFLIVLLDKKLLNVLKVH